MAVEHERRASSDADPDRAVNHRTMNHRPVNDGSVNDRSMNDGAAMEGRSAALGAMRGGVRRRTLVATRAAWSAWSALRKGQCRGREHQCRGNG
jgi:hypothetical protein